MEPTFTAAERAASRPVHEELRRQRLDAGLSLHDVGDRTRIQLEYLQAIEDGRLEALPEGLYQRGFIRSYLGAIGVQDDRLVVELTVQLIQQSEARRNASADPLEHLLVELQPPSRVSFRSFVVLLLVAGGCLWQFFPGAKPRSAILAAGPAATGFDLDRASDAAPAALVSAPAPPAAAPETAARTHAPPVLRAPSTPVPQQAPAAAVLHAVDRVWVRISPRTRPSRDVLLQQGDRVELTEPTRLWIGNAGGLELVVDGRGKPLGRKGQVRKLLIDPRDGASLPDG